MGPCRFAVLDVWRGLRRDRVYSATIVLTLALTSGGTTAMFSMVDGVLLRPLGYRQPDQLVVLNEVWHEFANRVPKLEVNERHFEYWREHAQSFEGLAQYLRLPAHLGGPGPAAEVTIIRSSGSLFNVLGASAAIGRTLSPDDEGDGRPRVVVLADSLWRERFGSDPSVLGRSLTLDGSPFTIVGVLPPDFRLPVKERLVADVQAFIIMPIRLGWIGDHNHLAVGRLRPGVSPDQARAELDVLQRQVSEIATARAMTPVTLSTVVTPLSDSVVGGSRRGLLLLLGAVGAVLLLACFNIANLSLTRAVTRGREAAIRSALGASRGRLIGRTLLEQLMLSMVGGALGLWVAWGGLALFVRAAPVDIPRLDEVTIDGRVVLFTTGASLIAGLVMALLPAWRIASTNAQASLRAGSAAAGAGHGAHRVRAALLAVQVTVAVTLLVVTALVSTSLLRVLALDRGFETDRVLTASISFPASQYPDEASRIVLYDRLLDTVTAIPAVETATVTSMLPLGGEGQVNLIEAAGGVPRADRPSANFRFVAPDYFRTLGIPLLRGRAFTRSDRRDDRLTPVVISAAVADLLLPHQDPIGRQLKRGMNTERGFEVVGVVADVRLTSLERVPPLMVYVPYWWDTRTRTFTSLLVKTTAGPDALAPELRRAIAGVDPAIAVDAIRPLEARVEAATALRRYQVQLFVGFGAVALTIAALGVYAVTSYTVSQRRREMNIRAALGARRAEVFRLILRQSSQPIAAGVVAGAGLALGGAGLVRSLLYDVDARDPAILAAAATLVGVLAMGVALLAARQSTALDPASALREE